MRACKKTEKGNTQLQEDRERKEHHAQQQEEWEGEGREGEHTQQKEEGEGGGAHSLRKEGRRRRTPASTPKNAKLNASHVTTRPDARKVSVNVKSRCGGEGEGEGNEKMEEMGGGCVEGGHTFTVCTMENVKTHTMEQRKPLHKLLQGDGG